MMDTSTRNAMTPLERYERIMEFARNGSDPQQLADRFGLTVRRITQILAAGPPEPKRNHGRPCPNLIDGERCGGSSRVLKVWDEDDAGVRVRRCLECGHEWHTEEKARDNVKKSTGGIPLAY